jgi:NAD(P)-dependent dehydrogenase (short-subunit alcohol dehydrogenase family)
MCVLACDCEATVVNNAADTQYAHFLDLSLADFNRVLQVNLIAPFQISRICAQHMSEQHTPGCIVHISSILSAHAIENMCGYVTTKAALEGLTRAMALDLGPRGIRVNAVTPGLVSTANQLRKMNPTDVAALPAYIPSGRFAKPEEIAAFVLGLCSDCRYAILTACVVSVLQHESDSPHCVRFLTSAHCFQLYCKWRHSFYVNGATLAVDGGLGAREAGPLNSV